ncbi:acyltransferase [Marinagarivorans algicola]|uniref:acyltransferase n=1 Tax=Marinagarivorans algicola TaxID=1513270 RepID=UPI0006B9A743|nr:acyltransferase [Marinagarivorans algicola]
MLADLYAKRKFDIYSDRLGPDCPFSHWKLYFKSSAKRLCVRKFKVFGDGAEFRAGAYAVTCSKISLGDKVVIRPGTMLFADPRDGCEGEILIENKVLIGSGVHIYTANHKYDDMEATPIYDQGHYRPKSVRVESGAWIGANAILLPGVTIGCNSVVAAGSVVTKSTSPGTVVAGVPARVIKVS